MEKNKPLRKFQAGQISCTIWNNIIEKDGKTIDMKTFSLQKQYKDGEEWKESKSFNINDLPKVVLVISQAYKYVVLYKDKEE